MLLAALDTDCSHVLAWTGSIIHMVVMSVTLLDHKISFYGFTSPKLLIFFGLFTGLSASHSHSQTGAGSRFPCRPGELRVRETV